jgi:hypothetical protein
MVSLIAIMLFIYHKMLAVYLKNDETGHVNTKARTQAPKSNTQHNTVKLDVGLLLLERA